MDASPLHGRLARELARHFLVHLDAELAKPAEIIDRATFDGPPDREVTTAVRDDLVRWCPEVRRGVLPAENLFQRWSERGGRFVYELYSWGAYNVIFLDRLKDLAEATTESRVRLEQRMNEILRRYDFRARGVGAAFMLDSENTLRELLGPIAEAAFPADAEPARRILLRQSRRMQTTLYEFFERALQRALDDNERLLANILPRPICAELIANGRVEPALIGNCAVLFTDFVHFSATAARLSPKETLARLERYFSEFDAIAARHGLEKIKTIGDSYMAAAGVPSPHPAPERAVCLAALEMLAVSAEIARDFEVDGTAWEIRIGLHAGPVMAGVIGRTKFAYDVWGATVNLASRMESASAPGRINASRPVHDAVREEFAWEPRGRRPVKHLAEAEMFFLLAQR